MVDAPGGVSADVAAVALDAVALRHVAPRALLGRRHCAFRHPAARDGTGQEVSEPHGPGRKGFKNGVGPGTGTPGNMYIMQIITAMPYIFQCAC